MSVTTINRAQDQGHPHAEGTGHPLVRLARRVRSALALDTLRGRFLFMAVALLAALTGTAWLLDNHLRGVSSGNTADIAERYRVFELTRDMANDLWETDRLLQSSMLQPSDAIRRQYSDLVGHLIADARTLAAIPWVQRTAGMRERGERLARDLTRLRAEGLRLMDIRTDPVRTFPAMPIMMQRMQPVVDESISAATLAIEEARSHIDEPGQLEALRLYYDTLYAWSRMVDSFRLYVSSRFGIFDGSRDAAMRRQAASLEDYSERVLRNIAQLEELDRRGQLEFQQVISLEQLRRLHQQWHQAWRSVDSIWSSESWRLDTQLLQNTLQPLTQEVWANVRAIEQAIDANSTSDLSLLAKAAALLSRSLWLVVLMTAAITGLALFAFETRIRRPIARVAAALKAEAQGGAGVALPATSLVETRDLTAAFDHMRREVRSRQDRLQAVLDYSVEAIVTVDEHGIIESVNPAATQLFGYEAAEMTGRNVSMLMPEPARSRHDGFLQRYLETGEVRIIGREREELGMRKDGTTVPLAIKTSVMHVDGRRLFTSMIADISERKAMIEQLEAMLEQLNAREQRLHTILNNTAEGIITFDEWGVIEGLNHSAERLFGWKEVDIVGKSMAELIAPEGRETRDGYLDHFVRAEIQRLIGHEDEVAGRYRDGSTFPMAIKITGMQLEGKQKYIALVSNISERKALMEHLRRLAEHDGLTGLFNRSYFQAELERVVERVHRSESANCALLYIDLDHFKYVNDTLGHAAGDKLLIEAANILNRRARKSDLVARLGGDEFTVLIYDTNPDTVGKVADSFRRHLADYEFRYEGNTVTIGCSIGVAVVDPVVRSPAEIMSRADLACHLAKRGGRNQVHVFTPDDAKDVTTMSLDMGWSRRIRDAVENNRFTLACQPIVHSRTREAHIYEVLVRMLDAGDGLIMPSGFLPTAERFGLSLDIDRWVIVHAIETLAAQRTAVPGLCYSINLSAQTLNTPAVCDLIQDRLRATGLEPGALIFEITETAAIADMSAAATLLARLRALGCRTALDDFGSGMSSFAYLKDLPVDMVKIDGRFVKHIATSHVDQAMVRAMNDIAHALGKQTVAEFVENEEAFAILVGLGLDYTQGYHHGRPETIAPCSAIAAHAGLPNYCRV